VLELESIRIVAALLAMISSVLYIFALWTECGTMKSFRFLTGGFCMMTTIAFSLRLALDVANFSYFMVIIWYLLTLFIFALATWSTYD